MELNKLFNKKNIIKLKLNKRMMLIAFLMILCLVDVLCQNEYNLIQPQ